ncbi:hypothetical protein C2S52_016147 [Perilla frutescens var. hirtella]|nr:hypothetical protein C2S52_016147 [Perilla frutescens var. hirtella]
MDDLSKFEKYPWGSISYKFMVDSIVDARARSKNMPKKKMKSKFDIYGFIFVFQLWAFEISRELGAYCGEQIDMVMLDEEKRLLEENKTLLELEQAVEETPILKANRPSVKQRITYSAGDDRKPAKKRYRLRSAGEAFPKSPSSIDLSSSKIRNSEFHHNFTGDKCKERSFRMRKTGVTYSTATLLKHEAMIESLRATICSHCICGGDKPKANGDGVFPRDVNVVVCDSFAEVVSPRMKQNVDADCTPKSAKKSGDMDIEKDDDPIDGEGDEPDAEINVRDDIKEVIALDESESRVSEPSKYSTLRIVIPDLARKISSLLGESYDPMRLYSIENVANIKSWRTKVAKNEMPSILRLPVFVKQCNIDVMLNFLLVKTKHIPHLFRRRWTSMDMHHWWTMMKSGFNANAMVLHKYVHSHLPRERGVAWKEVGNIYGVAHVLKSHWVAYGINLDDETITVYDSLSRLHSWNSMKKHFESMSRFIP